MEARKGVSITSGAKGDTSRTIDPNQSLDVYVRKTGALISKNFAEDPVIRYMLSSLSDEARLAYLPTYISSLMKAALLNDAIFQEANDWSCCAIWMPPGKRVDNPFTILQAGFLSVLWNIGVGGCKRMLWDFEHQNDACKRMGLVDGKGNKVALYYYLFFIATDFPARGRGLASEVVSRWQRRATEEGLPIWLEATTKHSRDIYARLGFDVVQEMTLGEGTHAASGAFKHDGPGVSIWAMIWWPEGKR